MKLSEFKDYIINKYGEKEWKNYESTYAYFIHSLTEEEQLKVVQITGTKIRYINNPSEEIQLGAVKENGYALEYIDNPSEEVIIEAIHNTPYAIQYLSNPSEKNTIISCKTKSIIYNKYKKSN